MINIKKLIVKKGNLKNELLGSSRKNDKFI